jgi:serine/alanine adding enzyme
MRFKKIHISELNNVKVLNCINNNSGTVFHEPAFNKLVSKYFDTDLYYLIDEGMSYKFICPIHEKKENFFNKYISYKALGDIPYGGFIGDTKHLPTPVKAKLFEKIVYSSIPSKKLHVDFNFNTGETVMVNLRLTEDEIFNQVINSKRRNMIRKAIKNEVSIKTYTTMEGFDSYRSLLEELHRRLDYTHLKIDFYKELFSEYSKKDQAAILLSFINGKLCSGNMIIGNKNYIHYYKGASATEFKNVGFGELLQWESIRWAKKNGSKFYDLCVIDKEKLPSLYRFKTGISSCIYYYDVFSESGLGFKLFQRLSKIK